MQYKVWDYRSPDATLNLNERDRSIIPPGVYFGYEVRLDTVNNVAGQFIIAHDLNVDAPINLQGGGLGTAFASLGAVTYFSLLRSRDNVTVIEAGGATLPDGKQGYAPLRANGETGTPVTVNASWPLSSVVHRIDYIVAEFNYQVPTPQQAVYRSIEGTISGPPTLANNQVLLAEVHVKAGTDAANWFSPGQVRIYNVEPKQLDSSLNRLGAEFVNILRPGAYYGYEPTVTGSSQVDLSAGGLVDGFGRIIKDAGPITTFNLSSFIPGGSTIRFVAIVAVTSSGLNSNPTAPVYILVPGDPGLYPTTAQILAAAQSQVSSEAGNENCITLVMVRLSSSGIIQAMKTERLAVPDELLVTDGVIYKPSSLRVGSEGLRTILDLIWNTIKLESAPRRHTVITEGVFYHDSDLVIPSGIEISGLRSNAVHVFPNSGAALSLAGRLDRNLTVTISSSSQTGVPAGSTKYTITVGSAANDFYSKKFIHKDPVLLAYNNPSYSSFLEGYYYQAPNPATPNVFEAIFVGTPFPTLPISLGGADIAVLKTGAALSNSSIEVGTFKSSVNANCSVGLVNASNAELGYNRDMLAANISVASSLTDIAAGNPQPLFAGRGNRIGRVEVTGTTPATFGESNDSSLLGYVRLVDGANKFIIKGSQQVLQQVFGKLELSCLDSVVDLVFAPTPTWDYSIVVTALQARNVVMKVQGAPVNYSAAVAGARTKIPGTVNVRSGTGTFAGYSTGAVIQFGPNEYLDPSTYRAFISLRDDTPGVPGTDPSISPIGAIWVDTKISSGFTVRNSGWASGAGPQALENITPAGTIYGVSLVNLPIAPSTVTLIVTIAGIDYTLNDNGDGTFSGMTNPGVLASPAPNVNYSTGLLSFQTSAVPSAIKVQYRFGPWLFDWVAVQDQ